MNTINQKITFALYGQTWRMHLIKFEIALHKRGFIFYNLFCLVVIGRMDKENAVPLSLQCYEKANHCFDTRPSFINTVDSHFLKLFKLNINFTSLENN